MVRIARRMALTAATLVVFAGCNLAAGIFPDGLMRYEAYTDLAGSLDPERVWEFSFAIIRDSRDASGHPEYLVLVNDDRSFGGDHLVVFDADLKALGRYTFEELDAMDRANPYKGRGPMVDANGMIVVGNRRFTVSSGKLVYKDSLPQLWQHGLAVPEATTPNISDIHAESDFLKYRRHALDWASTIEVSWDIGTAGWYKVVGTWVTELDVLMVVNHDPDPADYGHILSMSRAEFAEGTLPAGELRVNRTSGTVPGSNEIRYDTLGYTDAGFAAYQEGSNQYVLFDRSGFTIASSEMVPDNDRPRNQRQLYGRTSGWYIFDMKEMTVVRRAWWWL